jgi:arabinogalactan oligomer/maltooligosaccharide transport system substrate-binding protein
MSKITNGTTGCTKGFKYGKDYVIEAFPNGPKGKSTPFIGVRGYFETKQVDKSANGVAVTKLLNFVAGPVAGAYYFTKYSVRPANLVAAKKVANVPFQAGFAKAGVGAMPMPNIPAMDKVWGDWGTIEGNILSGKSPVTDWQVTMDKITASIK